MPSSQIAMTSVWMMLKKKYIPEICLVEINKCGLVERWMKRKT